MASGQVDLYAFPCKTQSSLSSDLLREGLLKPTCFEQTYGGIVFWLDQGFNPLDRAGSDQHSRRKKDQFFAPTSPTKSTGNIHRQNGAFIINMKSYQAYLFVVGVLTDVDHYI